jgi:hypothetical protein
MKEKFIVNNILNATSIEDKNSTLTLRLFICANKQSGVNC